MIGDAPVVKWISRRASDALFWVRVLAGAPASLDQRVANVSSFGIILDQLRVWFSGRMTAFQAVDGSSILPTRTK